MHWSKWLVPVLALLAAPLAAQARSGYGTTFNGLYGTAGTRLDSCNTCHVAGSKARNPYGADMEARILAGQSDRNALIAIEPLDSDGDTFSNIDEINGLYFPGDPADHPTVATPCLDADNDGYAVCDGVCALPAGKSCGDCNDRNAAVNPGVTEICTNGIDDNCDGRTDAADPLCASPALSDYDISGLRAPRRAATGRQATVKVVVLEVVPGTASLTVTATQNGVTTTLGSVSPLAAGTYSFSMAVTVTGDITWTATIADQDPDTDAATATTSVAR